MWCRSCQQDVPAVASKDDATVRCARCQADLSGKPSVTSKPSTTSKPGSANADVPGSPAAVPQDRRPALETDAFNWTSEAVPRTWESWELAEDLRAADRLVNSLGIWRVDAAHETPHDSRPPDPSNAPPRSSATNRPRRDHSTTGHRRTRTRGSWLIWLVLSLGLMTFAFGAVLLGWSFWMGRADLWRLGMPFTLAGQAALVIGLVLQLDGLWRSNQAATESLDDLDAQLDELRQATTLLSTSHSGPAQSFYAHMASGAGPKLLLADLKSQLDLLAIKMGDESR